MPSEFERNLNKPLSNEEARKEIEAQNEEEFLKKLSKQNSKKLIKLTPLERESIAKHIVDLYNEEKEAFKEKADKIDAFDEVWRMEPINLVGDDGESPTYRTPLSTVNVEVLHANIMNVFFTPKDLLRVMPTEQGDIPKVKKLDIFGNWSMTNEMDIFANCDRMFHSTNKNGETPYIVHWVKEYGTEIEIKPLMNPANPEEPLLDEDTKQPMTQERENVKLLYDGPRMEVFSRKDYIQPENALWGKVPDWEMRIIRLTSDVVLRRDLEGVYYKGTHDDIGSWGAEKTEDGANTATKKDGGTVPLGKTEKIFVNFFGRMRIEAIKEDEKGEESFEELEDEFIGTVEITSETLCQLKKNRFPLKMRPIGLDILLPDDNGRRGGIGVIEFNDGNQRANDSLMSQFIFGTVQSNNPFGFFTPTGNQRNEPLKIKSGYMFPTADPNSVNMIKIPPPDITIVEAMRSIQLNSQLLFGISDFTAGVESQVDPDAPAKKVQFIVAQGNVRLNLIIKRKNRTLKDIFKRWYLLYQANMPENKFMRIAGEDANNPWKFEKMNISDFALKSIPDFELTGNVLNVNKQAEASKALAIYGVFIKNPFFSPQTTEGLRALRELTTWLLDKFDETGIASFLPPIRKSVQTPEEENALFMQGDEGEPTEGEDHIKHIRVHNELILDSNAPEEVRKKALEHVQKHADLLKKQITTQAVLGGAGGQRQGQANQNVVPAGGVEGTPGGNQAGIQ